jgi:hypothetical protein
MRVEVDLIKLLALAEKLEDLEKDIFLLSDNALFAANSVVERTDGRKYQPLDTALKKVAGCTADAKELADKIRSNLIYQAGVLRVAAYSYKEKDKIERVN